MKKCILCNRVILNINKRKKINKFCSKKCMRIYTYARTRNQKSIYVKIPMDTYIQLLNNNCTPLQT